MNHIQRIKEMNRIMGYDFRKSGLFAIENRPIGDKINSTIESLRKVNIKGSYVNKSGKIGEGEDFIHNYSIVSGKEFYNFDFAFFKKNKLIALQEVTFHQPSRQAAYFHMIDLIERKLWLEKNGINVPLLFLTKKERKYSSCKHLFPPDVVLYLLSKGIYTFFQDSSLFQEMKNIIKKVLSEKDWRVYLNEYERKLRILMGDELKNRSENFIQSAYACKSRRDNKFEYKVHEWLEKHGLNPKGKIIVKNTFYDTFMVPDNFFELNRESWYCFVTDGVWKHNIGYCGALKHMFNQNGKCLVIISNDWKPYEFNKNSRLWIYLKKYADIVLTRNKLENNESINSLLAGVAKSGQMH